MRMIHRIFIIFFLMYGNAFGEVVYEAEVGDLYNGIEKGGDHCFIVNKFVVSGDVNPVELAEQQRILSFFSGQCLELAHLNVILKVMDDWYLKRGESFKKVYLPAQDFTKNILFLVVKRNL